MKFDPSDFNAFSIRVQLAVLSNVPLSSVIRNLSTYHTKASFYRQRINQIGDTGSGVHTVYDSAVLSENILGILPRLKIKRLRSG